MLAATYHIIVVNVDNVHKNKVFSEADRIILSILDMMILS